MPVSTFGYQLRANASSEVGVQTLEMICTKSTVGISMYFIGSDNPFDISSGHSPWYSGNYS